MLKRKPTSVVKQGRPAASAFTLIEILCVVAIMGIIALLVAPSLAPQDDIAVSAAARVVIADLQFAQHQAIATGSNIYVRFTPCGDSGNGGSYAIFSDSALDQAVENPITGKDYAQSFGTGAQRPFDVVAITGLNLNAPGNTILVFNSLGTPSVCPMNNTDAPVLMSAPGSITLSCGTMRVVLTILPDTGETTASAAESQ